jgi:transposase
MQYVGLDIHTKRSSMCILNEDGKIVKQELIHGPWPKVMDRLRAINESFSVCYEASCGYGHLHDCMTPLASRVTVAHPGQLRLIFKSKKKHDRVDARKIAKLLYLDEVPAVHVPRVEVRSWRKLIEFRQKLLGKRVSSKNQIRSVLRGNAIVAPRGLWTGKGLDWLERLELAAGEKLTVEMEIEQIRELTGKIKRIEQELAKIAGGHAGVGLLMTIPGVGIRTAEAFCAYVDDIRRFGRTRQVGSYFGLVPCQDSSAGNHRFGHITHEGPATVRKLLCESAWSCVRYNPTLRGFFQRVMGNDPDRKKIAVVATAHHLCRIMAAMLRSGEIWRGSAPGAVRTEQAGLTSPGSVEPRLAAEGSGLGKRP